VVVSVDPSTTKAATLPGSGFKGTLALAYLPLDLILPLAGVVLRRLDLNAPLLPGGGEEPADAVRLPIGGVHDLGQRSGLWASDQFQDLRALALGAGRSGFLVGSRFRSLLRRLGWLLRGRFDGLRAFLGLGCVLLATSTLLRGGLGRPNRR